MRNKVLGFFLFFSLTLNVLTVSVASVTSFVSGLFEAVSGAGSVLGVIGDQLRDSRTQTDKLVAELDIERKARTKATTELSATRLRLADALTEVAELRRDTIVTYRGNKRLIQHAVADTSERISRRTAVGASRNLTATFAEALPVAGVAVVVTATALELNDACVIMQDLHELDVAFNPGNDFGPDATEVCGLKVPTTDELWQFVKASPGVAWERARNSMPGMPELDTSRLYDLFPNLSVPW